MSAPPTPPTVVPLPGVEGGADGAGAWRLTSGVTLLWRGDGSFQLEHADDGVVVTGLDHAVAARLARPPRDPGAPGAAGAGATAAAPDAVDLLALERLVELGYLRAEPRGPARTAPPPRRSRPGAVPGGAAAGDADPAADDPDHDDPADDDPAHDDPVHDPPRDEASTPDASGGGPVDDDAARDAARRAALRSTRVEVAGLTAVAPYVGALLAAAGVGAVGFSGSGPVRRRHLLPGGLSGADEGRRFAAAAADVVARAAPRTDVGPPGDHEPDLVVLCLDAPVEPDLRDLLHRTRRAHLVVHVDPTRGEVGPLVLPGVSACLRCADLYRLDHDPSWTVLAVQLIARAGLGEPPDPALTARTGALAAALAVQWLAGDPRAGGTLDGSWELRTGGVAPRRRSRRPHPECGCRAAWGVRTART